MAQLLLIALQHSSLSCGMTRWLIIALISTCSMAYSQTAADYYKTATQYLGQGNYKNAVYNYNKCIELNPNIAEAYDYRGRAKAGLNQHNDAVKDFKKALALKPFADGYNNLGLSYQALRKFNDAIAAYGKAIELDANMYQPYYNRGVTYLTTKSYHVALKDFDKTIALAPRYAAAYFNRGITQQGLLQYDKAIANFDKTIALKPGFADAYSKRGLIHLIKGENTLAVADFSKVVALEPNHFYGWYNRGSAYHQMEKHQQALNDYNKAIALNPNYALIYHDRGFLKLSIGFDDEGALSDLQKALELDPHLPPQATFNLGSAKYVLGRTTEACDHWYKALNLGYTRAKESIDKYCTK